MTTVDEDFNALYARIKELEAADKRNLKTTEVYRRKLAEKDSLITDLHLSDKVKTARIQELEEELVIARGKAAGRGRIADANLTAENARLREALDGWERYAINAGITFVPYDKGEE